VLLPLRFPAQEESRRPHTSSPPNGSLRASLSDIFQADIFQGSLRSLWLGGRQSEHKACLRSRLRVSSHREVEVCCVGIYSDKPAA
jgi:hypothetical protein